MNSVIVEIQQNERARVERFSPGSAAAVQELQRIANEATAAVAAQQSARAAAIHQARQTIVRAATLAHSAERAAELVDFDPHAAAEYVMRKFLADDPTWREAAAFNGAVIVLQPHLRVLPGFPGDFSLMENGESLGVRPQGGAS